MNYYFDPQHSPLVTLVAEGHHNTRPCPFSGHYSLAGLGGSMSALMSGQLNCHRGVMHAGCSASDDLIVESTCSKNLDKVMTKWSCHGRWRDQNKQMLVLSTPIFNGVTSNFVCLSYTEKEGILEATASTNSCQFDEYQRTFNITSSGPCLQALTGSGVERPKIVWTLMAFLVGIKVIFAW